MLASLLLAATLASAPAAKPPVVIAINGLIDSSSDVVEGVSHVSQTGAPYIHLDLNTPGGSVGAGLEIINALNSSGVPVECEVHDMALSMGAIILESACSTRIMHNSSLVMFHEAHGNSQAGTQDEAQDQYATFAALNRMVALRVAPALGLTVDQYVARVRNHEWWILGETALKEHVADEVRPDVRPTPVPAKK